MFQNLWKHSLSSFITGFHITASLSWILLILAIILEVCGTTSMKMSHGFTRRGPIIAMFIFYGLGFIPLTLALRRIDLSVAYAIWSGLGMLIITLIGIFYFKEPATLLKGISIALIILGIIGLNLARSH
jgi:small multidrug resistance pump